MSELETIAATFQPSEPVFVAQYSVYDPQEIDFQVKFDRFSLINHDNDADVITTILAKYCRESYDHEVKCFISAIDLNAAYADIFYKVMVFYTLNSPLKNPKQTKLYKWLRSMSTLHEGYKYPLSVAIIGLLRYIHKDKELTYNSKTPSHPRAKSVIATLELIREKYETKR
jgi:hypothetical protein